MAAPSHLRLAIAAAANVCAEESVEAAGRGPEKGSADLVTQVQVKSDGLKFLHCAIYWNSVEKGQLPILVVPAGRLSALQDRCKPSHLATFRIAAARSAVDGTDDKTRFISLASSCGMFPLAQSPLN